jgi:lysophospholipid acyltransferase (LPLAT)-like uncharacterized protein
MRGSLLAQSAVMKTCEQAPNPARRTRFLSKFAATLLARLLRAYGYFCYCTSRFDRTAAAEQSLRATWDKGLPTIYTFWHDEFLTLSLNAFCRRLQFPACIANDAFGGKVVALAWAAHGAPVVEIKRNEAREVRLARIRNALLEQRRLAIAADYGAPWFKARPTSQQLAASSGGYVTAMHLHAMRNAVVGFGGWRVRVPTPFNHYVLHLSAPMQADAATPETVGQALWALRQRAREPVALAAADNPNKRTAAVRAVRLVGQLGFRQFWTPNRFGPTSDAGCRRSVSGCSS